MTLMVHDPQLASELIAQRTALGVDRYDEVWNGVYVLSPIASNEHRSLTTELSAILKVTVDWQGLGRTFNGANVSDRRDDWRQNYRIPDILVFKRDSSAEDCGTHWLGGPELAIEIVSPGDRTLEKLSFYGSVGTRELLVIDRSPWQLTLYAINSDRNLVPVGISRLDQPATVHSTEFPLAFSLNAEASSLDVLKSSGTLIRSIPIKL